MKSTLLQMLVVIFFVVFAHCWAFDKIIKTKNDPPISESDIQNIAVKLKTVLDPNNSQMSLKKSINATSNNDYVFYRDNGTLRYLSDATDKFGLYKKSSEKLETSILQFLDAQRNLFKLKKPSDEFKVNKSSTDASGNKHITFSQYAAGIPVWGKEITFHFTPNNSMYSINASYAITPEVNFANNIDSLKAIQIAEEEMRKTTSFVSKSIQTNYLQNYKGPVATKYIWIDPANEKPFCTWYVEYRPNLRDDWIFFINITDGKILKKFNKTPTEGPVPAIALDAANISRIIQVYNSDTAYFLIDATRSIWSPFQTNIVENPQGALWTVASNPYQTGPFIYTNIKSYDNVWTDQIAVSAHYNAGVTFQYFLNTFNRKGIDGNGSTIISVVHWPDYDGTAYDNAFWNGSFVAYGDGKIFKPFAAGLDITAHEMSHGVVQYTVDLEYESQSGALNESFADIFASMVDRDDWLIGEDIGFNGPIRNMENPELCGQPSHMKDYMYASIDNDNGGVHTNSGIPNHAYFLLAQQIGKSKSEQIFYRILSCNYLNHQSDFFDLRIAAIRAASDLFGSGSFEVAAVKKAFDDVGIYESSLPTLSDLPKDKSEWLVAINGITNNQKLVTFPLQSNGNSFRYLSLSPVFVNSGNPFCLVHDNTFIVFVDKNNYLRCIDLKNASESLISDKSIWSSVAISSDKHFVAATTTSRDSSIFLFDLLEPSNSKQITINTAETREDGYSIKYADALKFNRNTSIIFDCNYTSNRDTSLWTIASIDIKSGRTFFLIPTLNNQMNYICPSFSQSNLNQLLFEADDTKNNLIEIKTLDLVSGSIRSIAKAQIPVTFPSFIKGDTCIVFEQRYDSANVQLFEKNLSITQTDPQLLTYNYIRPSSFSSNATPVKWKTIASAAPIIYCKKIQKCCGSLALDFTVNKSSMVSIGIYNILGRKVQQFSNINFVPGNYHYVLVNTRNRLSMPGNGVYICKLTAESQCKQEVYATTINFAGKNE